MKEESTTKATLQQSVFERIEADKLCPHGRMLFICRDSAVWLMWLISVLVGAVAVAVTLFVIMQSQSVLYEATHDSFLAFLFDVIPYLWLVVFVGMVLLAMANLRYTKRGYRYTVVQIMASSVVLSLAGGAMLQLLGLGSVIDHRLGDGMPMYASQDKLEKTLWQAPQDGRLFGRQVATTLAPTSTIIFEDTAGERWTINVSELSSYDISLLSNFELVRMVGTTSSATERRFHACATFPWQSEIVDATWMNNERRAFLERMLAHTKQAEDRVEMIEAVAYAPGVFDAVEMNTCANLAMMRRVEKYMRE